MACSGGAVVLCASRCYIMLPQIKHGTYFPGNARAYTGGAAVLFAPPVHGNVLYAVVLEVSTSPTMQNAKPHNTEHSLLRCLAFQEKEQESKEVLTLLSFYSDHSAAFRNWTAVRQRGTSNAFVSAFFEGKERSRDNGVRSSSLPQARHARTHLPIPFPAFSLDV